MLKKFAVVYSRTCFFNIFKFLKSETPVKVWENQKKLSKHSPTARSPKLPLVFLQLDRNRLHVFYFLKFRTQSPVPLSSVRLSHDPNALLSLVIQVESSNMGSVAARVALYQTVGTYLAPWKTSTSLRVNLEISPLSM